MLSDDNSGTRGETETRCLQKGHGSDIGGVSDYQRTQRRVTDLREDGQLRMQLNRTLCVKEKVNTEQTPGRVTLM